MKYFVVVFKMLIFCMVVQWELFVVDFGKFRLFHHRGTQVFFACVFQSKSDGEDETRLWQV